MELESLDKYIHLTQLARGTEVMFAGQPCLNISENSDNYSWSIYPVFAKLTYGASIFEDVPFCIESFQSQEQAIADGLSVLHSLGAFNGEVDLPEDTFANGGVNESVYQKNKLSENVLKSIKSDCRSYASKHSTSLMEAQDIAIGLFESIITEHDQSVDEGAFSNFTNKIIGTAPIKPKYKVGQTVSYETDQHQPDWTDGGRGKGKITKYSNGHYTVNGNPVNHFEIKKVHDQSVDEGAFDWKTPETAAAVVKKSRGKPTFGATVDEMKDRMRENIAAGKRPHTGFDRNEKLRILRSGAMEHPEFAGTHVKAAGRPHGTTKAAAVAKKAAEPTVFSMWSGLGKQKK